MIQYLKKNILLFVIIFLSVALALLLIIPSGQDLLRLFSYIIAVCLIIIAFLFFGMAFQDRTLLSKKTKLNSRTSLIIQSIVILALAVLVFIFHKYTPKLIGVFILLIVVIKTIYENERFRYLLRNSWKILIGLLFVFGTEPLINLVFLIVGILLIGFAGYLLYLLIVNYQHGRPNIINKYFIAYIVRRSRK